MKRTKLLALLGAAVLSVGAVGMVYANDLATDHPNQIGVAVDTIADEDCSDFTGAKAVGEGEVGLHFILTKPEAETGNISGSVDGDPFGPVAGEFHGQGEGAMHFYVVVDGDGDSEIDSATTDVNGGNLTLSHICVGDTVTTTTTTTTNSGGDQPNTDTLSGNRTSTPADSAWLLVVALGVLLASLVVLSPARSKR